jgi:hypothetical protein
MIERDARVLEHQRAPDQRAYKEATMAVREVIYFPFRAQLGSRFLAPAAPLRAPDAKSPTRAKTESSPPACHNCLTPLVSLRSERVSAWRRRGGAAETHLGSSKSRTARRSR